MGLPPAGILGRKHVPVGSGVSAATSSSLVSSFVWCPASGLGRFPKKCAIQQDGDDSSAWARKHLGSSIDITGSVKSSIIQTSPTSPPSDGRATMSPIARPEPQARRAAPLAAAACPAPPVQHLRQTDRFCEAGTYYDFSSSACEPCPPGTSSSDG